MTYVLLSVCTSMFLNSAHCSRRACGARCGPCSAICLGSTIFNMKLYQWSHVASGNGDTILVTCVCCYAVPPGRVPAGHRPCGMDRAIALLVSAH